MAAQFTLSVHDIDAGGLARSFDLPLPWLAQVLGDTDVTASEPGHADLRFSKTGHDIVVRGKVKGTLSIPCARCLEPTTFPVDTEISLMLRPARSEHGAHAGHAHATHGAHGAKEAKEPAGKEAAAKEPAKDTVAKDAGAPRKPGAKDAARSNGAAKKSRPHEEEEYEFSSEEADTDVYDGETVVLDDFLREALLLEAPSFPLCSEDCPGIRPSPRAAAERGEPPLDPRLSPLRALKTKLMLAASNPDAAREADRGKSFDPSKEAPAVPPGTKIAAERPVLTGKPARPKIQAHRTRDSIGASGAQGKARAKHSPKKKAK